MVLRIRLGNGPQVDSQRRKNRRIALGISALLTPAAAMTSVLGLWGIAADLSWASSFAIPSGLFSHWQVWIGAAVLLQLCSRSLNRYGKSEDTATSA